MDNLFTSASSLAEHLKQNASAPFLQSPERTITYQQLADDLSSEDSPQSRPYTLLQDADPYQVMLAFLKATLNESHLLIVDPTLHHESLARYREAWNLEEHLTEKLPPMLWLATSGSTGHPKLIGHPYSTLFLATQALELKPHPTRWGLCLPTHHMGGLMVLLRQFVHGGCVSEIKKLGQLPRLEALSVVPTQLERLLSSPSLSVLKQCRFLLLGGAPATRELLKRAQEHHLAVCPSYGLTETAGVVALCPPLNESPPIEELPLSLGKALPGNQLGLTAEGLLTVDSPYLASYRIEAHQTPTKIERPLITSDRAFSRTDGSIVFAGRADHLFLSGGENIDPYEIENMLKLDPCFQRATILPRPHSDLGFVPHLKLELSEELSLDGLKAALRLNQELRTRLSPLKVPRSFELAPSYNGLKIPRQQWIQELASLHDSLKQEAQLLFLPGLFGLAEDWAPVLLALLENQRSSLLLNTLNLFIDAKSREQYFQQLIREVKRLRQHQKLILVGYSLGGRVALELLKREPALAEGLILIAAHPGLESKEEKQARLPFDSRLHQQMANIQNPDQARSFLLDWYAMPLFGELRKQKDHEERIEAQIKGLNFQTLAKVQDFTALSKQERLTEVCHQRPTLYLYGEDDLRFKALASLFPQSVEIPACSHACHLEQPQKVAQVIERALKNWV